MKSRVFRLAAGFLIAFSLVAALAAAQKALEAISASDMKHHLKFLAAPEFRGRSAPSAELDIASKYIALEAERIGLKPLLPGGSYFQDVPVEVTTISPAKSHLRLITASGERRYYFPRSFTSNMRTGNEWAAAGGLVFVGSALDGSDPKASLLSGVDLGGRFAVMLEEPSPSGGLQRTGAAVRDLGRARLLREKGAIGLITIINREREDILARKNLSFEPGQRLKFPDIDTVNPAPPPAAPRAEPPFINSIEVRHEEGRALLGVTEEELIGLFEALEKKQTVGPKNLPARTCDVAVLFDVRKTSTPNVAAVLPGRDAKLREEYVVIGSHHDHNPPRDGRVFPGADDNGSGAVAMLAIAKAFIIERPRRSVIFVWHTAEERGLIGAYYFVQHCPVPVEKISANLNLDMIARNDPDGIYLIGSNKLSTELDRSIRSMNARHMGLKLDYKFEDPGHADKFFFRSDQYPYIRYGIPGVWFFCGTTEDYHQETDVEEKADYQKMAKVTKLAYLVAMDIGNRPGPLKLDVRPDVTARGAHNMKVLWPPPPAAPKPKK